MDRFLEKYNLPKLNEEEAESLNRPITADEIETVIKKLPTNKIRYERGEITADTTETERIVRNYYEELYAKKFENLDEMDTFLEKNNLPKLNEEKAENLSRPITTDKIEAVIKKLPTHKTPGPDGFTGEF